jgi:hypothetical protein
MSSGKMAELSPINTFEKKILAHSQAKLPRSHLKYKGVTAIERTCNGLMGRDERVTVEQSNNRTVEVERMIPLQLEMNE